MQEGPLVSSLHSYIGFEVRRTHLALARKFGEIFSDVELKSGQFSILAAISEHPNQTQTVIAKQLGLDRSTMVPLLDVLQKKQLIERERDPNNRRAHILTITTKGKRVLNKSRPLIDEHETAVTKGITKLEKRQLLRLLSQLRLNSE